jgi:hypothetical protein
MLIGRQMGIEKVRVAAANEGRRRTGKVWPMYHVANLRQYRIGVSIPCRLPGRFAHCCTCGEFRSLFYLGSDRCYFGGFVGF